MKLFWHWSLKRMPSPVVGWHPFFHRNDTVNSWAMDSLISFFENDPSLEARYRLAFVHQQAGDSAQANAVLDSIYNNYDLTDEQLEIHADYMALFGVLQDLKQDSLSILQLDSIQINTLQTLALNDKYLPGVYARNILLANGLSGYEEPVVLPDPYKSTVIEKDYSKVSASVVKRSFLRVYPNPAGQYFIAEYQLEKDYIEVTLEILDISSRQVGEIQLTGRQNQVVVPVRNWKQGMYMVRLIGDGQMSDSQKVMIINR